MKNRHPAFNIIFSDATDHQKIQQLESHFKEQRPNLIKFKTANGDSLLQAACYKSGKDLIEWLLAKDFRLIDSKGANGANVYAVSLANNNQQALEFFYMHRDCPKLISGVDNEGFTTNAYAVLSGNIELLQQNINLLGGNNNLHHKNQIAAISHLLLRCCKRYEERLPMVQFLVSEYKADPNHFDSEGCTAVHCAATYGHVQIISYLLECCKVDVNLKTKTELADTPFTIAARNCMVDVLKKLVEHKADIHAADSRGYNALHLAAEIGHIPVISYLVNDCKMDVNIVAKDDFACTPCIVAGAADNLQILNLLVQYKADITYKDKTGKTALDYAMQYPDFDDLLNSKSPIKNEPSIKDAESKAEWSRTNLAFKKKLEKALKIKEKESQKKARKLAKNKLRKERKKEKNELASQPHESVKNVQDVIPDKKSVEDIDLPSPVNDSSDEEADDASLLLEQKPVAANASPFEEDNEGFAKVVNKKKSKQLKKSQLVANATTSVLFPIPSFFQAQIASPEGQPEGFLESKKPSESNATFFSEPWYKKILKPACDFLKEKMSSLDVSGCQIDESQQYLLINLTLKQANDLGLLGIEIQDFLQPGSKFNAKILIKQLMNQKVEEIGDMNEPGSIPGGSF